MEEKINVPIPPKKFPPPPPNINKAESVKNEEVKKVPHQPLPNVPPKTQTENEVVTENNEKVEIAEKKKTKKVKIKKERENVKSLALFGIIGGGVLLIVFLVLLIIL